MDCNLWEGVIIGASGGSIAGITVYLIQFLHQKVRDHLEMGRINSWLLDNSSDQQWRTTRTIASWNNLTEDRVQYLCSKDKNVKLSTGQNEGLWAHRNNVREATYE